MNSTNFSFYVYHLVSCFPYLQLMYNIIFGNASRNMLKRLDCIKQTFFILDVMFERYLFPKNHTGLPPGLVPLKSCHSA